MYFVIDVDEDGGVSITIHDESSLLKGLTDTEETGEPIIKGKQCLALNELEACYSIEDWGYKFNKHTLIIKGEVIVPKLVEVALRYTL